MFTFKLHSSDTDITGRHLEKCPQGCPGSFAQCAAILIEDSEVWGSHIGGSEDLSLLECDTVITVPYHGGEGTTVRQNASGAASHVGRLEFSSYSYQGIKGYSFCGFILWSVFWNDKYAIFFMVNNGRYSCIASSVQDFQAPDSIFLHFTFCQRILNMYLQVIIHN